MTKECSLKEAYIERKLDEFQPGWRNGEDITAETKQKIRDYTNSKIQDDEIKVTACLSNYSIGHMAKNIRKLKNLPKPNKSNKGNRKGRGKESVLTPSEATEQDNVVDEVPKQEPEVTKCEATHLEEQFKELIEKYRSEHPNNLEHIFMKCIKVIEYELSKAPIEEPAPISETSPTPTEGQE